VEGRCGSDGNADRNRGKTTRNRYKTVITRGESRCGRGFRAASALDSCTCVVTLVSPSGRRADGGVCGACAIGAVFRKVPDEIPAEHDALVLWNAYRWVCAVPLGAMRGA